MYAIVQWMVLDFLDDVVAYAYVKAISQRLRVVRCVVAGASCVRLKCCSASGSRQGHGKYSVI